MDSDFNWVSVMCPWCRLPRFRPAELLIKSNQPGLFWSGLVWSGSGLVSFDRLTKLKISQPCGSCGPRFIHPYTAAAATATVSATAAATAAVSWSCSCYCSLVLSLLTRPATTWIGPLCYPSPGTFLPLRPLLSTGLPLTAASGKGLLVTTAGSPIYACL